MNAGVRSATPGWTCSVTASPAPTVSVAPTVAGARPDVSVLIVTYGTGSIVVDTIASIVDAASAQGAARPIVEVVVVDQPHPDRGDATLTLLRSFTAGVRVVRPARNLGFAGGCELAALHARADVLAFVNPDVTVPVGWLGPLVAALDEPEVSIAAPVLLDPDGAVQEVGQHLDASGSTRPRRDLPEGGGIVTVDYASAACWLMRRDEHERIGGFDPDYFPAYFEDVDLAVRAAALGGRTVVHTGVRVVHHHGAGTPDRAAPAFAQQAVFRAKWPDLPWTRPRAVGPSGR